MSGSRMMSGSPLLMGDNTIPGVQIHKEFKVLIPEIEAACRKMGLDYFPIVCEFMTYDEIAEIASYGGFPVRYPHWKWGMEYEEMSMGYEFGQFRISEMCINNDPEYIYFLDSNTLVDNIDVLSHAIGHGDFMKNNIYFAQTNRKMMDKLANHGTRVRRYMSRWGRERVTDFINHVLRIDTLIDPMKAWQEKQIKEPILRDERKKVVRRRFTPENSYMDEWVNPKEFLQEQNKEIEKRETAEYLDLFKGPTKDIFGYLKDHAALKPWQQDIVSMLYEEAMYFAPQRQTKMINEGWASYVDYYIMCREGLCSLGSPTPDCGIWHYAEHKARVLGGKYSTNPYKLGFQLFLEIEDRWNKGKFGREYEDCQDMVKRAEWDTKTGLGVEKIFEVRKHYNDYTMLSEYFTPEFCEKYEYYEYRKFPSGEWKIVSRDFKAIKEKLLKRYLNGGLPDIRLVDPNHLGKGWFLLQHYHDGRPLYEPYARDTMCSIWKIWQNTVVLATKDDDGVQEMVYVCDGLDPTKVLHMTREKYEEEYMG